MVLLKNYVNFILRVNFIDFLIKMKGKINLKKNEIFNGCLKFSGINF